MQRLKIVSLICLLGTVAPVFANTTPAETKPTITNQEREKVVLTTELDLIQCIVKNRQKWGVAIPDDCRKSYELLLLLNEALALNIKKTAGNLDKN